MRAVVAGFILFCAAVTSAGAQDVLGSGSTFCFPAIAKWADAYQKASGVRIVYQPIGSARGITEINHDIVDFAVSEAPLDDAQLLRDGLAQFPLVIGGIVPVVNIAGIGAGQLRVTGPLLASIYLGKVKRWNDPAIVALNPGLALPDQAIQVVHRSDGSGTTFVFADYLSKVSTEWKARVGEGTTVAWPTGFGGKGNGDVAGKVAALHGAIGYIDYTYAVHAKLAYALVQNQAGRFVTPDMASFEAATGGVAWPRERDFYVMLTDAPAPDAYPIMATSFALMRKYPKQQDRAGNTLAFLRWVLQNGQATASEQNYLPLPAQLVQEIEGYWEMQRH